MTIPTVREHNLETGEVIDREMTAEELDKWKADKAALEAAAEAGIAKATQKAALLEKLGITEDEAKLLLG
jgi:hypothetical protein